MGSWCKGLSIDSTGELCKDTWLSCQGYGFVKQTSNLFGCIVFALKQDIYFHIFPVCQSAKWIETHMYAIG